MQIYAYNAPICVWWPGSAWTHWKSLCSLPDFLTANREPASKEDGVREGKRGEGRKERKGKRDGRDKRGGKGGNSRSYIHHRAQTVRLKQMKFYIKTQKK